MDILYFFNERTRFVRRFYAAASSVFRDQMDKISEGEAPYDDPPYEESGEPPYMEEWRDAKEALDVLGLTCVSMLSEALKVFLLAWESAIGVHWEQGERNNLFRKHGLKGYVSSLGAMRLTPSPCPADLDLLEQVILARNAAQHPDELTQLVPKHRRADLVKHPRPFFMDEAESVYMEGDLADVPFLVPRMRVSPEKLYRATDEVDKFAAWLDESAKVMR